MKKPLFSVTASDCKWDYLIGDGNGGQNLQKRKTAVRCTHKASGAVGFSKDGRSQELNRRKAFERMADTKEFKQWHKAEVARRTGQAAAIEAAVDKQMEERNFKTEIKVKDKWTKANKEDLSE